MGVLTRLFSGDRAMLEPHPNEPRPRRTASNFNPVMATAARITIAEVGELAPVGAIEPESVATPHLYVDHLVERR